MSEVNPFLSFIESYWKILLIFAVYWQSILILKQYGILKRFNIDNHGPLLMIRTTKGQKFLDRVASVKGFWRVFGDAGIPLMLLGMFLMFALIIFSDIMMVTSLYEQTMPAPSEIHELRNIFLIPGINQFIPVVWGIIGLIVTLVVHEFSHAIMSKAEDIRVKSMGLILVLIPIGGFAEPDEEQLFGIRDKDKGRENGVTSDQKIASRRQRIRILTAGVMANFVTAFVAFVLFFIVIGSIAPVSNVVITDVVPGSPADDIGLTEMTVITHINDKKIENGSVFHTHIASLPVGEVFRMGIKKDGKTSEVLLKSDIGKSGIISGVKFNEIVPGMPGEKAGLVEGTIITRIDDVPIYDTQDFSDFMANTTSGQEIIIYTIVANEQINYSITLASHPADGEKGFIGISGFSTLVISRSIGVSVGEYPARELLHFLQMIPHMMAGVVGWVILLVLPFPNPFIGSFAGFNTSIYMFYEPIGWAVPLGVGVFWLANSLLWIGWMNFYVGLFNCLPMLPLDGGHVFRDTLHSILARLFGNEERMGMIAGKVATGFAILMLASLLFMIIAPKLAHGL
ncbi:MAG: site-2 protease family protein [Methanosarcinales archaeon]|nr:site-2 protease family protein [Methanosarcinales archaeon]